MRVWLNGDIIHKDDATVTVFDRGFLFGDGVYEGIRVFNRTPLGMDQHIKRLQRSLAATKITGFDPRQLRTITSSLLEANDLRDGFVYLQITRGAEPIRRHVPECSLTPTVFAYAVDAPPLEEITAPLQLECITLEDTRWRLCAIKGISMLANVLAGIDTSQRQADEAILHRDGLVSEGTHTNVFAIENDTLITPLIDADPPILHGVTRQLVLEAANACSLKSQIRPMQPAELRTADEIFLTSSSKLIAAVTRLDARPVGDGRIGPATSRLFASLREQVAEACSVNLHFNV